MPVISFLLIGIFSFVNLAGNVFADKNGGGFFVGSNTTFNFNATISGSSATNGGGVYIANGGTFNLSGGSIYGNTATTTGNNIYNAGTFTMTGGRVGGMSPYKRIDENGTISQTGNFIYLGSYPKTIKASNVTINENDIDEKGYYLGSDGERYAKVKANPYKNNYVYTDGTTIVKNTEYYFKVEPIKWRILSESNGQATIFAEETITAGIPFYISEDNRTINGNTVYANNYEYSTIRAWLNGYNGSAYGVEDYSGFTVGSYLNNSFLDQAFTRAESDLILTTEIDNSAETTSATSNPYICNNTSDKVWLLSYQEVKNSDVLTYLIRRKKTTDFARVNSAYCDTQSYVQYNSQWFLRSPNSTYKDCVIDVESDGLFAYQSVQFPYRCVLPALTINLDSTFNYELSTGYSIYNTGTMNLYGGNVYDNVYSSANINTKMACNIAGTITLGNSATITLQDYAGTTPNYAINLSTARTAGTILTFVGSSTEPDLTKLNISGYDTNAFEIVSEKNSSGNWTVSLVDIAIDFPLNWKTEISSTSYMTTTITPANITKIQFVATVPSGYTKIGTLSTGLPVYQGTTATEIAFVGGNIKAPYSSVELFRNLSALTTINFSAFSTSNVTTMYSMFQGCNNLTSLDLSKFNTLKVTNMSFMFRDCKSLTSLDLSNFVTSKVTNMSYMFNGCESLTSLNVSGFNTTNVTNMSFMFSQCSGLTNLDLSNFSTSKVANMSDMFQYCSGLTNLDLSNFNTSKVTNMSNMFNGCESLTSLNVSNFDTSKVTNMSNMFVNCKSLTSLNVSGFNTTNVTNMSNMFSGCNNLTSLNLSNFNTSNVTNMHSMFSYCSGLTNLDLSNFNTSNVTDMSAMFQICRALTNIDLSNFNTSNVTNMNSMFDDCLSLTSLNLSNFNTSNVTNMNYMFSYCRGLTSLNLSSFDMSKVTSYRSMFNFGSAGKLKTLKTPYNNTSALSITTGSTLYNVETGAVVTSVPANTTASKTYATQLTLTFDANGGTCNTTSATAYYNVSLRDSGFVFPYPTKSGYMFSGWYQNTSFVGTKLSLDSVFTTNCKFYAKWEEQNPPSGGGSSNSPLYIGWEETGRPLVNEVSEDIKRYNNNYTLESIDGFVIISEYNSSSFQDYALVERLNISHLPVQIYIVELNPEGPNASYINCSNCSLIVAIYVQEFAFGISNTWEGAVFDENEQLFRELAPNAIFWDLRGFCTENFKPNDQVDGPTTEQYKLILGRQVQLCILPENFYLGIDWSLSEAGCVVQSYLFEDVTGDYSFVSSKNNDQNEICRDIGIAKISLNFNQERTIQNILNLNDEKLLETKRKIKLVSNVKKE